MPKGKPTTTPKASAAAADDATPMAIDQEQKSVEVVVPTEPQQAQGGEVAQSSSSTTVEGGAQQQEATSATANEEVAAGGGGGAAEALAEDEPTFEINEIVLSRDNGLLYESKILKVSEATEDVGKQYFIHYKGWKSKWDKWVPASLVLKMTEENKKLQAQLQANRKRPAAAVRTKKEEAAVAAAEDTDAAADSGSVGSDKKKVELEPEVEEDNHDPQVKLAMAFTLKKQLVEDWEMVTREPYQLVPLPRNPTAASILASFLEQKKDKAAATPLQSQRFQELMEGIRMYFDRALPLILLYRHERDQYEKVKAHYGDNEFKPSDVYGAEHLLRLFVRLPHLLAQTAMTPQEVTQVQAKLGEFLKFLQKNSDTFFLTQYTRRECLDDMISSTASKTTTMIVAAAGGSSKGAPQASSSSSSGDVEAATKDAGAGAVVHQEPTPMEVAANE